MPQTIRRAYVARSIRTGRPLLPVRLVINHRLAIAYVASPAHVQEANEYGDRYAYFGDDLGLPGLFYPLDRTKVH